MGIGRLETYRLDREILAIHSTGDRRIPIMVPTGAIVTTTQGPLNGVRMLDVLWDEKTVMIFSADLRFRGTLINPEQ